MTKKDIGFSKFTVHMNHLRASLRMQIQLSGSEVWPRLAYLMTKVLPFEGLHLREENASCIHNFKCSSYQNEKGKKKEINHSPFSNVFLLT